MTKIEYIDKYLEKLRRRLITTNNAFDYASQDDRDHLPERFLGIW